ncbi:hypothetical protein PHMEG_00028410 [Phytophthora megakarya]|uniref:Retrotransposon gag domain-containing protein n=1 Tax=Phytophthora megakarya TaxID=4795 RepID=A0A225V511_9STRA|nr:hypothetical protein PHMEG_00028410 [Phytophthora megakarya]
MFAPKAARQAVWAELIEELSHPVNSTSTSQVAEDTAHAYPSSTALADWTASKAGTELQRWKRKLKTAFRSKDVGAGRQPVARSAGERLNPANIPLPRTPKKTTREVFGSTEQSQYFHDSHMVTPRLDCQAEQTESTANTRPGIEKISSRRQAAADDSSSDEGNPFYQEDDENDATTELAWKIRKLTAMEEMDPTPRFEIAQHRPLGKITPFRGKLDDSENSMQWLRGFVYEMKGTHTSPNEWCMAFQLCLRDSAVHWHRALSRKTKRTWSLLSDKFISYNCSQSISEHSPSEKEHIRDYLSRLNGYARSANIKFKHSGREAKEHAKHFLETCVDRDLERQLTPMQLRDIHMLEDIVSDIQKVEKQVSSRSSSQSSSRRDDNHHSSSSGNNGHHDSRSRNRREVVVNHVILLVSRWSMHS